MNAQYTNDLKVYVQLPFIEINLISLRIFYIETDFFLIPVRHNYIRIECTKFKHQSIKIVYLIH